MQAAQQLVIPSEIVSAGVDWITGTSKTGGCKPEMEQLAIHCFQRAVDAGEEVKNTHLLGYTGYSTKHIFHGERPGGAIMRVSGEAAKDLWRSVAEVSDNVTRLDMQVTVYTILEKPHVAKVIHEQIKRKELGIVPIKNATYIEGHPTGETININKRRSVSSARVYDKASESGLGVPRTLWRYEVECHSPLAGAYLSALRAGHTPSTTAARLVHRWFERRGITTIFERPEGSSTLDMTIAKRDRNTLQWFRDSLSKTIRVQVTKHGLDAVVEALGLYSPINPS